MSFYPICFVEAGTGDQAFAKYVTLTKKGCRVKLILMDNNMGDHTMNGLETGQALRQFEESNLAYKKTHIIAHTCDDPQIIKQNPLFKHMDDISYKPMAHDNVIRCLRRY